MKLTLSLTISSCARRLVLSGSAASSFRMISIFLPATVSPCCCMYSLIALSICLPVDAWPPVIGRIRPILTLSCAARGRRGAHRTARRRLAARQYLMRMNMNFSPPDRSWLSSQVPRRLPHHSPDFPVSVAGATWRLPAARCQSRRWIGLPAPGRAPQACAAGSDRKPGLGAMIPSSSAANRSSVAFEDGDVVNSAPIGSCACHVICTGRTNKMFLSDRGSGTGWLTPGPHAAALNAMHP